MKKIIRPAIVLAAVFGAAVIGRRIRKSQVSATTADTTSTTQPEPQTPASTPSFSSPDAHHRLRVVGKINLSRRGPSRRRRISGQCSASTSTPAPESDLKGKGQNDRRNSLPTAVDTPTSPARRSPLHGKENGNWQMPRIQESAMILLRGVGAPDKEISDAVGLSVRSVSRRLRGITPYPSSSLSIAA